MSYSKSEKNQYILLLFLILISIVFVFEIAGFEVIGGDPDRFFRPLKSELVRNINNFQLPLWSDLFGFGMPLAAQSEIGAFYLPHYLTYSIFGVGSGYRLSMVLHQWLAAFFIWKLCIRWNADTLGCMIAVFIYLFGGFPTIQASKEWAVLGMAWLPGSFLGTEIWLQTKDRKGLAILGLSLASLALIGHFQMAQITSLGLLFWVFARLIGNRHLIRRIPGLIFSTAIAVCIASPQIALSWRYAEEVGATERSFSTLAYYSYPLMNFLELIFPLWTRTLTGGPEGAYWTIHQTTQFEACQFVGTCGIVFAVIGLFRRTAGNITLGLCVLSILSIILITMPQWSPSGYAAVLRFPGMGLFRCPARYGILLHFSLALLAARGVGEKGGRLPIIILISLFTVSLYELFKIPEMVYLVSGSRIKLNFNLATTVAEGFVFFLFALFLSTRNLDKSTVWQAALLIFVFCEMCFFYLTGPTRWGGSIDLFNSSQILKTVAMNGPENSVCGPVDNIPVRIGVRTTAAYFGVKMPNANEMAKSIVESTNRLDRQGRNGEYDNYLRKLGATHQLQLSPGQGSEVFPDDSLSRVIAPLQGRNQPLYLRKIENAENDIAVFNGQLQGVKDDETAFLQWLNQPVNSNNIFYSSGQISQINEIQPLKIDQNAVIESSEALRHFRVKHDGSFILILRRTFDTGWKVNAKNNSEARLFPINGGLTGLLVKSEEMKSNTIEIELYYWPGVLNYTLPLAAAGIGCIILLFIPIKSGKPEISD